MQRRDFLWSMTAVAFASGRARAQIEATVRGSRDDLKGAKTIRIDTSYDRELREMLAVEVAKELPDLKVVGEDEPSDLVLRCTHGFSDDPGLATIDPAISAETGSNGRKPLTRTQMPADPARPGTYRQEPDDQDASEEPRRFLVGSVLRPVSGGPAHEAIQFRQAIRIKTELTVRDFVRKLAKELKRANEASH